jgi:hypothetical protein
MKGTQGRGRRSAIAVAAMICVWALFAQAAEAAKPQITNVHIVAVSGTTATLAAEVSPGGKATTWHFEYGSSGCAVSTCAAFPKPEGKLPAGELLVPIEATIEGLTPNATYHFLLSAKNTEGTTKSLDRVFATRVAPGAGLPDNRAYEQASPVNKDGGDAIGKVGLVKAADDGSAISFNSTFGIPGGKGAQALPTYLATRGVDWSTQGLLPPPVFGERAQAQGWLPDFSETFSNATQLSKPRIKALVAQSTAGGPARIVSPYVANPEYSFIGTDADNSTVFFEAKVKLPPEEGKEPIAEAIEGRPNVYAWDRATGKISLASIFNTPEAPPKGSFAGPYDWSAGTNSTALSLGGAARNYYLQGTHAVTDSGDIYFTEAGTGQLFLRLNPTRPESSVVAGKCTKAEDACTLHVSASKRTVPDSAGAQPAAFAASTADGSEAFFTSPEMLTNSANTGPEQPKAAIGIGNVATGAIENESFIPQRAVGVTVDDKYIYWADPADGAIGRAELGNPASADPAFIAPEQTECEEKIELNPETEPGVFTKEKVTAASRPRYLTTDSKYIYWTNTGVLDNEGNPKDGGGTIGRAELDGSEASVEPEFICGTANPQGIAVNASNIYWANAAKDPNRNAIAKATIEGESINQEFFSPGLVPIGVALDASHLYFTANTINGTGSFVSRIPLGGGTEEFTFIGAAGLRGIALDGTYIYWAHQRENEVGRIPIADFPKLAPCEAVPTCEREFVKEVKGDLNGLAVNVEHLYWSVNGDAGTNPGNDLYRYLAGSEGLEDLTPDPSGDGAEVQGVLGASADGAYLYFAANGDLDGGGKGTQGTCHTFQPHGSIATTSGSCNLYLRHEGKTSLVSPINGKDALDWTGSAEGIFGGAFDISKAAFLGDGGKVLLFRSVEKLSGYNNEGTPELYRYSAEDGSLRCASCSPDGEAPSGGAGTDSIGYPGSLSPPVDSVAVTESRNLSANGNRAFFETSNVLVPADTNGQAGCPKSTCQDVYEWEAPEEGSCIKGGVAYSPINEGCIYLISTGKSPYPSYFGDASETGKDVFFFTRQRLVGQDTDEQQDVYDARVEGGIPSQNPPPPNPCLGVEACHGPPQAPPSGSAGGSATFVGPADPKPKHQKQGKKHKRHHKAKKQQKKANSKGGQGR